MSKRRSKIALILGLLLSSLFIVAACGSSNSIIGTWSNDEGTMIFHENNTMTISELGRQTISASWQTDGNLLSITLAGQTQLREFSISGNTLTIYPPATHPNDPTLVLTRQ